MHFGRILVVTYIARQPRFVGGQEFELAHTERAAPYKVLRIIGIHIHRRSTLHKPTAGGSIAYHIYRIDNLGSMASDGYGIVANIHIHRIFAFLCYLPLIVRVILIDLAVADLG